MFSASGRLFPDVVEIVIEIPRGTRNKYEYDEEAGVYRLDRVLSSAVFYNFDYGFIEGTRAGDGDHTDALLVIDEPTFTGCHVWARPIGGLEMRDEKGLDFKTLCVAIGDPHQQHIERLEPGPPAPARRDRALLHDLQAARGQGGRRRRLARRRTGAASAERGPRAVRGASDGWLTADARAVRRRAVCRPDARSRPAARSSSGSARGPLGRIAALGPTSTSLHLTVRFLGDDAGRRWCPTSRVAGGRGASRDRAVRRPARGRRLVPGRTQPRTLWLGIERRRPTSSRPSRRRLDAALAPLGWPRDDRAVPRPPHGRPARRGAGRRRHGRRRGARGRRRGLAHRVPGRPASSSTGAHRRRAGRATSRSRTRRAASAARAALCAPAPHAYARASPATPAPEVAIRMAAVLPRRTKFVLAEDRIPRAWYNIAADLPVPPPPAAPPGHPPAHRPRRPRAAVPDGAHQAGRQPASARSRSRTRSARPTRSTARRRSTARTASRRRSIPRPTSTTSTRASARPGSHKPNTAIAAGLLQQGGGRRRASRPRPAPGSGAARSPSPAPLFGLEVKVYMVRASYDQKPYRRILMETYGAEVVPEPSARRRNYGRKVLARGPRTRRARSGIAISEAVEDAATRDGHEVLARARCSTTCCSTRR